MNDKQAKIDDKNKPQKCFCGKDIYKDDKCILHCEKSNDFFGRDEGRKEFYDALVVYIVEQFSDERYLPVSDYLKNPEHGLVRLQGNGAVENIVKNKQVLFNKIFFPENRGSDIFNHEPILQRLGKIEFCQCEFVCSWIELQDIECFFDECVFHKSWSIGNFKILRNTNGVLYQRCIFKKSVSLYNTERETVQSFDADLFFNCCFYDKIELSGINMEGKIFNNLYFESTIREILISNCTFNSQFILNSATVENFECRDTIFKDKVELTSNIFRNMTIIDTSFNKESNYFNTKFYEFEAIRTNFAGLVEFEKCEFGTVDNTGGKYVTYFAYVVFLSFTNFRDTIFLSGLNLRNITLKETPNFLGVKVQDKNTDRETYRIIKASLDDQSNYIEANEFYALEMKAKEQELKQTKGFSQDKFVFWLGGIISDHSTNWLKALKWIFGFGVVMFFCYQWRTDNYAFDLDALFNYGQYYQGFIGFLDDFAKFMNPFSRKMDETVNTGYAIWLTHKVFSGFLVYHFIVSLRRNTKR